MRSDPCQCVTRGKELELNECSTALVLDDRIVLALV
jgi:hypothetical protein